MSNCCFWSKYCCKAKDSHITEVEIKESNLRDSNDLHIQNKETNQNKQSFRVNSTKSKPNSNKVNVCIECKDDNDKCSNNSSIKKYSFIASKRIQKKDSHYKIHNKSRNKSNSSHSSFYSSSIIYNESSLERESIKKSNRTCCHCCNISKNSCDCEQVLNTKIKRITMNANELFLNNIILDEEIASAAQLIIEDLDGHLLKGKKLHIDAAGMINGNRNKRDGLAFFGVDHSIPNNTNRSINNDYHKINDFLLNLNEDNPSHLDRLFMIYYYRQTAKYYLKSFIKDTLNNKIIITLKVTNPYKIYKKTFVLLGNLMMVLQASGKQIQINMVSHKEKGDDVRSSSSMSMNKEYNFSSEISDRVTIGRENCTINVESVYLSKIHCTLLYDDSRNRWELNDGNGEGNKGSKHGTWVLIDSECSFGDYDYYIIKLNKQTIQITKEDKT